MSPFQNKGVEIKHTVQKLPIGRLVQQNQQPIQYPDIIRLQSDTYALDQIYKQPSSEVYGDTEIQNEQTITHPESKVSLLFFY